MKTKFITSCRMALFLTSLLCADSLLAQKYYWMLPPNKVDVQSTTFTNTAVPNATTGTYSHADAAYDQNGNILFYVQGIYDTNNGYIYEIRSASGSLIGDIANEASGVGINSDLEIVPVPGGCLKFYVIHTYPYPLANGVVAYAVIDCSSGTPVIESSQNVLGGYSQYSSNVLGIAVSKSFTSPFAGRYLFVHHYNGISKLEIKSTGIVNGSSVVTVAQLPNWQADYEPKHAS
jgi:hypothetical protein